MTIARNEIFGPVLAVIGAEDEHSAIRIANDSHGLAVYVLSDSADLARYVVRLMPAGNIYMQGASHDRAEPFGGYKRPVKVASVWKNF
ncbi:hypothetical protein AOQ72_10725 [Bradyrhizobium yuanmingense]|uniref:Aldehyde dehydrogenase domain-containing protein n=1 Tax=Bradyrhizobium yuanmingense TaxID=108015 RepID=A0A0R3CZJ8_9BRAD|nr:aldehyde dehydrogenase family protein [Bradyrhizobium yuanmingense]KRQ00565.1 hypothetical protein AOQ72_10725 [Bradyrhizobium yuanmingense]